MSMQHASHPMRRSGDRIGRVVALTELPAGARAVVHRLRGGRAFAGRLAAMGIVPGVELMVVRNDRSGPLIVLVRGTRVALGRGGAGKIRVEGAPDGFVAGG